MGLSPLYSFVCRSYDGAKMKPALTPLPLPEGTEAERMDHLFRIVISKPKAAIDRQEKKWKRSQARKKRAKSSPA